MQRELQLEKLAFTYDSVNMFHHMRRHEFGNDAGNENSHWRVRWKEIIAHIEFSNSAPFTGEISNYYLYLSILLLVHASSRLYYQTIVWVELYSDYICGQACVRLLSEYAWRHEMLLWWFHMIVYVSVWYHLIKMKYQTVDSPIKELIIVVKKN